MMANSAAAARYPASFRSSLSMILAQKKIDSKHDLATCTVTVGLAGSRTVSYDSDWFLSHRHLLHDHHDDDGDGDTYACSRHHEQLSSHKTASIAPNIKTRVAFSSPDSTLGNNKFELTASPSPSLMRRVSILVFYPQQSRLHFLQVFHGAIVSVSVCDADTKVVLVQHSSTATMPRIPIPDLVAGRAYAITGTICLCGSARLISAASCTGSDANRHSHLEAGATEPVLVYIRIV